MSSEHVVVRQSEDWACVLVAPKASPAADSWTLAFTCDAGGEREGEKAALALLRGAHTVELEGRLEPANAAVLQQLTSPQVVRINNETRGPRSSLGAPTLIVAWRTSSSFVLPDLHVSPTTTRLVVEISDAGGPISPSNRRFLPALSSLDVTEVVLDFTRWDHVVVDPFVSRSLYSALAGLLMHGVHITLVHFERVFACMADTSVEQRPTRYTALPRRAEDALKVRIRETLRAAPQRPNARTLEHTVRELLAGITLVSEDERAKL